METTTLLADVILPLPLGQLFTYIVPRDFVDEVEVGKRVVVPFGSKKFYTAIIWAIHNTPPVDYKTKPIITVLDSVPLVDTLQIRFWEWIAAYYQSSIGDVYKAAVPVALKLESQTRILINEGFNAFDQLSAPEIRIMSTLSPSKDVSIQDLNNATGLKNILPHIKTLFEKGAIHVEEQLRNAYREKQQSLVRLCKKFSETEIGETLDSLHRAPIQQKILLNYLSLSKNFLEPVPQKVSVPELLKSTKATRSVLNSLVKKKILKIYQEKADRLKPVPAQQGDPCPLNEYQQAAYNAILEKFKEKNAVLLHGVTSSGKTEIYIHLIEHYLKQDKQVLYLLPEIALTTQIISRLQRVFGNRVGVYHSKFNDMERAEIWNTIHQDDPQKTYRVILGVRSSIFLPFNNLGLIIIDEEHENTYKQFDPSPRYHARDAALMLAKLHNAKTLLGTATPSIESYCNTQNGKYGLVNLIQRYQSIKLPEILIADTREARRKKTMKSLFTPQLYAHLKEALDKKEQAILFQNRRGFAPYMECTTCGWIEYCIRCDVTLTYHRNSNQLVCHYCGYKVPPRVNCKNCGSVKMDYRGYGTEKVEEELGILFPEARISRMDLDTTRSKKAYEKIIGDFENRKTDILIGTQMISKGLDFDNVSVVGIMNADTMLNFPDFRAFERSFQLMAQVAGRAGRKHKQGKVIIQTNHPEHPIILDVFNNDYLKMYHQQLKERKKYGYPPFCRLIIITIKHKNQTILNEAGLKFGRSLRKIFSSRVFGPQVPLINRIQHYNILRILLKIEKKSSLSKAKWILNKESVHLKAQENFKTLQIHFDVDPM